MATNPDPSLPNRNTIYLARSGQGKSQAVKQNPEIPKQGARVLIFDPNYDHKAHRYTTQKAVAAAVLRAVQSGRGFRIAYSPAFQNEDEHEFFCRLVWAVLDGRKITYFIDEELTGSGTRSGAAAPEHMRLLNQGRKFGLRYHAVAQKPEETSKTVMNACEVAIIGSVLGDPAQKLGKRYGIPGPAIADCQPLQFWRFDPANHREPQQFQLKYQKN
ncbi:hypothetical protein D8911_14590 (plasmid) [Levilactobacillus brevis]|nr:hypothetical protein D8911_14590 [Levilactobacillus brevis]